MAGLTTKTYFDKCAIAQQIEKSGISQTQIAKDVGVTNVHLSRVKNGSASPVLLAKIGQRLGFDYRQFLLPSEKIFDKS